MQVSWGSYTQQVLVLDKVVQEQIARLLLENGALQTEDT